MGLDSQSASDLQKQLRVLAKAVCCLPRHVPAVCVQQGALRSSEASSINSLTCIHAHNGDAATLACAADELIQDVSGVSLKTKLQGAGTIKQ
jgi:hypothetical protein